MPLSCQGLVAETGVKYGEGVSGSVLLAHAGVWHFLSIWVTQSHDQAEFSFSRKQADSKQNSFVSGFAGLQLLWGPCPTNSRRASNAKV